MIIIAAQAPPETIRRADDLWSWFCGRAREQVPEVAVGPGATSVEILPRIGPPRGGQGRAPLATHARQDAPAGASVHPAVMTQTAPCNAYSTGPRVVAV